MDPRTHERIPVTSSEESLDLYVDDAKKDARNTGGRRLRACPVVALLALAVHMTSAGCGIALSAIVVRFGIDMTTAGTVNLVARILVFAASCMGPFYVFMHLAASREHYVRSHQNGAPHIFGYVSVAVAVLVMRLGLPIWTAAVVLSALAAAQKGFDPSQGFLGNLEVWVQLGVASMALLSLIVLIIVTEITDRPFATSIFSRKSFLQGTDMIEERRDSLDLDISQKGHRPGDTKSRTEATTEKLKEESLGRSMANGPKFPGPPDDDYWEASRQRSPQRRYTVRDDRRQRRDTRRFDRPRRQDTARDDRPRRRDTAREDQPRRRQTWREERRQRRDSRRYDRTRSEYVPAALETAFAADAIQTDAREFSRRNVSPVSWRPPTRDSTYSQRKPSIPQMADSSPRHQDEVSTMPVARKSVAEPASQPPTIPLPPMPLHEMHEELTTAMSPPQPAFTQERPATAPEPDVHTAGSSPPSASEEAPSETPSLAQLLSALSTRAAARRRNSLVVRLADLAPRRQSIDIDQTTRNMTTMLFQQPEEAELVEIPRPPTAPRGLLSENGDPTGAHPLRRSRTASGTITMVYREPDELEDPEPAEVQRPATAPRESLLQRSNTDPSRRVRNFSRPRLPGAGAEDSEDADAETEVGSHSRSADRHSRRRGGQDPALRRSRSLPSLADRARAQDTLTEVGAGGATGGEREKVAARAPRFSPFPKLPDADRKVKGLGQGSTRRRDERIARWRAGVRGDEEAPAVTRSNDAGASPPRPEEEG